jgi:hypothetical protein
MTDELSASSQTRSGYRLDQTRKRQLGYIELAAMLISVSR